MAHHTSVVTEEPGEPKIVRTKIRYEANAGGRSCDANEPHRSRLFVFHNAETEEISVVYQRKDGNYGLIEPEL